MCVATSADSHQQPELALLTQDSETCGRREQPDSLWDKPSSKDAVQPAEKNVSGSEATMQPGSAEAAVRTFRQHLHSQAMKCMAFLSVDRDPAHIGSAASHWAQIRLRSHSSACCRLRAPSSCCSGV